MKYQIDLGDEEYIVIPEDVRKQIIADHLERYYLMASLLGTFIIGFLLGVIAYAL